MKEINIKKEERLLQIINKILTANSSELKITIPAESILFKNILNLRIFHRILDNSNIIAKIEAEGDVGKEMLSKVRNLDQDEADFSKYQESMRKDEVEIEERILEDKKDKKSFQLPKFSLPSFNFSNLKLIPVFIAGFALVSGIAYYFLVYKNTASVEVLVSSERFVKSFEIKVSSLKNTDVEGKVLKGESVSTVYQAVKEIPTTGKVDGGKRAEGEVKLLNKTDKTIKTSKDTKITYKESDKEYNFTIKDSVEVPGRTLTSTLPETFVSGEKTVDAVANSYGSSYNLAAGKSFSVSGYPTSELSAVVSSSFEGGVKNTLSAASEQDIKDLSSTSFEDFKSNFKFTTLPNKFVLKNSEVFSLASQKFSSELTQPAENIKVTQDINVSYLIYDYDQALSFVKASIKSLIPEGYELYGKDLQIELNSLGSISGSSADSKEANVQLTIKSYKIPLIDQEKIKKELAGKKLSEVSKYFDDLGVGYNIESSNGLLNLLGFPKDLTKINVSITKQ